jgi:hypothetical protein
MTPALLDAEWRRVDLLAACVIACRRGADPSTLERERLGELDREVAELRRGPAWSSFVERHGLTALDQEILSCAIAPEAEPQIGWTFQALQPGIGSPYPTPALMREPLFLDAQQARELFARLSPGAPLFRAGLLEQRVPGSYGPIVPTGGAHELLHGAAPGFVVPGAVRLETDAAWDDLVLPESCLALLREFLLWTTHREQVFGHWGARPSGGPVALFAGPSGTGKSFAAKVVAACLGRRLFRVDLGMLVSKYIGETEKNLNALFDAVRDKPALLLFDEADSLFGKRGEVREARDRYANMEVSHLLARIEEHSGPCILTTNWRQQLDPAFARRFQIVVEFPLPDAAQRRELWQRYLPPRAPRAPEVDAALLAESVALTGAQIRNAATHAAFLAAGGAMPITLGHLASAVLGELAKEGREVFASSLGQLGSHLPGGKTR